MTDITFAYPLEWPDGWPRITLRTSSRFKVTPGKAKEDLLLELERIGARYPVITSNLEVGRNGQILARQRQVLDPGIALYFEKDGVEMVLACDQYTDPFDNIRAVSLTIDALRRIERYGSSDLMKRAFTGFKALGTGSDSAPAPWWQVLELDQSTNDKKAIQAAYRMLSKRFHPDGSDPDTAKFQALHDAYTQGMNQPN